MVFYICVKFNFLIMAIINKVVDNTFDIYKDKIKSTFTGTFILWWIICHRNDLYDLFFNKYVDDGCEADIIENMFLTWESLIYILCSIGLSILSILSYYMIQYFLYDQIIYRYENVYKVKAYENNKGVVVPQLAYDSLVEV